MTGQFGPKTYKLNFYIKQKDANNSLKSVKLQLRGPDPCAGVVERTKTLNSNLFKLFGELGIITNEEYEEWKQEYTGGVSFQSFDEYVEAGSLIDFLQENKNSFGKQEVIAGIQFTDTKKAEWKVERIRNYIAQILKANYFDLCYTKDPRKKEILAIEFMNELYKYCDDSCNFDNFFNEPEGGSIGPELVKIREQANGLKFIVSPLPSCVDEFGTVHLCAYDKPSDWVQFLLNFNAEEARQKLSRRL